MKIKLDLAGTGFTTYLDSITIYSSVSPRTYALERIGDEIFIGPITGPVQMNSAKFTLPLISD